MAFLVAGDIFAAVVFPYLLSAFALTLLYGYTSVLIQFSLVHLPFTEPVRFLYILFGIQGIACTVALRTPHLRTTPSDLIGYCWQYARIVLAAMLTTFMLNFPLVALCNYYRSGIIAYVELGCLFLGGLIFYFLSRRSFLVLPELLAIRELVRGHDLESPETIVGRAWRND